MHRYAATSWHANEGSANLLAEAPAFGDIVQYSLRGAGDVADVLDKLYASVTSVASSSATRSQRFIHCFGLDTINGPIAQLRELILASTLRCPSLAAREEAVSALMRSIAVGELSLREAFSSLNALMEEPLPNYRCVN